MMVSGSDARIQSTAARMSWSEIWVQWQMIMAHLGLSSKPTKSVRKVKPSFSLTYRNDLTPRPVGSA
jgi:hypothetical protein